MWCQTPAEKLVDSELMCKGRWGSGECQTPSKDKKSLAGGGCKTPEVQGYLPSVEFEGTPLGSSPMCPVTPVEHTPNPGVETPGEICLTPADETPTGKCETPGGKVDNSSVRLRSLGF